MFVCSSFSLSCVFRVWLEDEVKRSRKRHISLKWGAPEETGNGGGRNGRRKIAVNESRKETVARHRTDY